VSDFGVAVVGAGFIGPVHVEAIRRPAGRSWGSWAWMKRSPRHRPRGWGSQGNI